jgi:hypothetical protein
MAYNTNSTPRKSTLLFDIDCRTTGSVKYAEGFGAPIRLVATVTTDQIIEAGECIAMLRVPKGFTVTGGQIAFTASATNAVIGLGDPFCCGRFLGPILAVAGSGVGVAFSPAGTTCWPNTIITKTNNTGDGCGIGYTYTCETDLIITNGYGEAGFGVGGGGTGTAVSGTYNGTLPSGWVCKVVLDGVQNSSNSNTA